MSEENNDKSGDDLQERIANAVPVARSFLETVLGMMGVEVEVDIDVEEDGLHCDLNTSEQEGGLLIGRHGATLDSLQYLTLRVLQAEGLGRMRITLDVGGYRERREKQIKDKEKMRKQAMRKRAQRTKPQVRKKTSGKNMKKVMKKKRKMAAKKSGDKVQRVVGWVNGLGGGL